MIPLTLEYAIENKFTGIKLIKYFKPHWTNEECDYYIWAFTCYPFGMEIVIDQLNKHLTEPEQHTVVGC